MAEDEEVTTWSCPHCTAENKDILEMTCTPMCGDCGLDVEWDDIFKLHQT
jgi:hypothetical protein